MDCWLKNGNRGDHDVETSNPVDAACLWNDFRDVSVFPLHSETSLVSLFRFNRIDHMVP